MNHICHTYTTIAATNNVGWGGGIRKTGNENTMDPLFLKTNIIKSGRVEGSNTTDPLFFKDHFKIRK